MIWHLLLAKVKIPSEIKPPLTQNFYHSVFFLHFQVLNQHIAANSNPSVPLHGQYPSHYSSRETGYNSGTEYNTQCNSGGYPRGYLNPDSTIVHQREEVETEIF